MLNSLFKLADAIPVAVPTFTDRFGSLSAIFGFIINTIIYVGWALVFVMLAFGFAQYVMSKGDEKAVNAAQQWVTYAIVGGVGLFFVGVLKVIIPQLVGGSLELTGVTDFGGTGTN